VAVEGAEAGELLPLVAGELPQERGFPVHDLVVREREHEVLVPGVDEENVSASWCQRRWTGSCATYPRVSCIHPMFHLNVKPRPPLSVERVTPGQAVDSSAVIETPGCVAWTTAFSSWRKPTASRSSRPP